jgi:PIN domain nuclease of toxin-antitoxin system
VRALPQGDDQACLTAVGIGEVVGHLVRLAGAPEDDAALDLAQLGLADALVVDPEHGLQAGLLRARHYHRKNCAVSLADWVALEAARANDAPLASADPHLLDICRNEGVRVIPLPDSTGHTRSP